MTQYVKKYIKKLWCSHSQKMPLHPTNLIWPDEGTFLSLPQLEFLPTSFQHRLRGQQIQTCHFLTVFLFQKEWGEKRRGDSGRPGTRQLV